MDSLDPSGPKLRPDQRPEPCLDPLPSFPTDKTLRAWIGARLADGGSRVTGARAYSSAVFRYDYDQGSLAIKTPVGGFWQRLLLRRELRAYQALQGIDGLVRCHQLLDGQWLILDWQDATPFRFAEIGDHQLFFQRLRTILDEMHRRGVAHGDLKKKENLLVAAGDEPIVLDLGTAVQRGSGLGLLLFGWLKRVDNNAWLKLKYQGDFSNLSEQDRRYFRPTLLESLGRRLRPPDQLPEGRNRERPRVSGGAGPTGTEASTRFLKTNGSETLPKDD